MSNFLKVVVFSLCVIGLYTLFAAVFTPPIKPEPPPVDEAASTSMTTEELIAFGERLFNGKGACGLCHDAAGDRAPRLDTVALKAIERIKAPNYKGAAKDPVAYIYESMTAPSAYVVAGYGVAGSNDKVSPMPDVSKEPIALGAVEMAAVTAYLQQRSGAAVTVQVDNMGR